MSILTYSKSKDANRAISAHFSVGEFGCVGTDKIIIDTALIALLESLRKKLKCSKIIINSGYRSPAHNKAVGGSSTSQHVKGKAADIVCYNSLGKISAKEVCCAAEDLGATGIGYISANATHIDVRSGAKWWGDETKGNRSISKINGAQSFYTYFGIVKPEVCPYIEPTISIKRGSRGTGVKWVQWQLNQHGYNCGKIDGVCGKNTATQIANFQRANGLLADGICGVKTKAALKS